MEIKLASPRDAEGVHAIYAQYCSTPITFELEPPGADEMRRRIEHTLTKFPWLVACVKEQAVGYAYAHSFRDRLAYRWTVETSVYVDERHHRQGIARALYSRLFEILGAQGFMTAMAGITLPNQSSVRLHETCGFGHVGVCRNVGFKNGQWHDVALLCRTINDLSANPSEPLSLEAVIQA